MSPQLAFTSSDAERFARLPAGRLQPERVRSEHPGDRAGALGCRVLVVQPDRMLARAIEHRLEIDGYGALAVAEVAQALRMVSVAAFDAVLLDRDLPDEDRRRLLGALCRPAPVVIMLTHRVETSDWLSGLDAGVDDYVVKPASLDEVAARLRAGLLRTGAGAAGPVRVGRLSYDLVTRRASVNGLTLRVSPSEQVILDTLVRDVGEPVARDILLAKLYGDAPAPTSNALDAQVSRLRRRLRDADAGVRLLTVRGEGYQLL